MASEDFIGLCTSSEIVIESVQTETREDIIDVHASSDTVSGNGKNELKEDFIDMRIPSGDLAIETVEDVVKISTTDLNEADAHARTSPCKEDIIHEKNSGQGIEDGELEEGQFVQKMELDNDFVHESHISQENFNLVETVKETGNINGVSGYDSIIAQNDRSAITNHDADESPISGVKRARMTYVDQEPSVHVIYKSLTRASKRKLEELLQQWSQWHAQQKFLDNDPNETLESGEQTFFPALYFGIEKASSTVTFWMDNQTNKEQNEFIPLDGDSVPMYDRGFVLGLTSEDGSANMEGKLEKVEDSRCFNCGSYSHGLKDCQKPRDNAAVNSARKQHNSKRNQTAGARNTPRYYQNSPGGKYDGIRPGFIGSETRQLLGLGELDPPPWLHRMREIGYPPGYLDPDYEDQPSGITIYADEINRHGEENGESLDTNNSEPKKKMTADFPGINAPIPENADERRWASLPEASRFDSSRSRSHSNRDRTSEISGNYAEPRRHQDYRDNGPPGVDSPRYSGYDPNYASDPYSPRGYPTTPILGRSLSDRGRWNPPVHNGSPSNSPYSPYASPTTLQSPPSYNSPSSESWAYGSRQNSSSDSLSRRNDRHRHRR